MNAVCHSPGPSWRQAFGPVDAVGVEERVAKYTTRSIKKASKLWGLRCAVSMVDLTTLEGKDTPGKVASLCRKAPNPCGTYGALVSKATGNDAATSVAPHEGADTSGRTLGAPVGDVRWIPCEQLAQGQAHGILALGGAV